MADRAPRRTYESPLRRRQTAETHERIVAAGAELVHELEGWDWRNLTVRAVAERAAVNERTVYRHFASERDLREAVMRRLEHEAGIDLEELELENLAEAVRKLFQYLPSFPVTPRSPRDPTLAAIDERRKDALRAAVGRRGEDFSPTEREMAAAVLDLLWDIPTYERLVTAWDLDGDDAAAAVTWAVRTLEEAIARGDGPSEED